MRNTKQMHSNRHAGSGIAVIRATCLMILFTPMLGWSQSESKVVPFSETKTQETSKTVNMANLPAVREVGFSQVFDRLGLSTLQQSRWNLFRERVDSYTAAYYRQMPSVPSTGDAATHQISRMVDNLQNRLAALEEVEAAAKSLYESLTPEQQKIANELLILTIPTFLPSSNESTRSDAGTRHNASKPEGAKRSR